MTNPRQPTPPEFAAGSCLPEEQLSRFLRKCGSAVKVFQGCRLFPPDRIEIGDSSQIDEGVRIFAGEGVVIGRHVHFAFNSSISGGGACEVGDFASFGAGVRLLTGTESLEDGQLLNPTIPAPFRAARRGRLVIGAHAALFTNAIVFPGVQVGAGAVAAAGAVVHHDLRPWTIYAGNPLVAVGTRDRDSVLRAAELCLTREIGH